MPRIRLVAALGSLRSRLRRLWPGRRRRDTPPAPTSDALGRRGEAAAARALRRAGCRILARRVRTSAGEIDLVALDGETVVLVEVKASLAPRTEGRGAPRPADRVGHAKRRRLLGASRRLDRGVLAGRSHRIDVVSVVFEGRRAVTTILRGAVRASRER